MLMPSSDWLVQVPLSQLVEIQGVLPELEQMRDENKQLKARIEGLHRTLFDALELLRELRKG